MTSRRVVTTRRADQDIDSAVEQYLAESAADTALAFVDALEKARDLLGSQPSIGSPRFAVELGMPELRGLALQKFPYVAFYTDGSDAVRIHRILHTRRDIPAELSEL